MCMCGAVPPPSLFTSTTCCRATATSYLFTCCKLRGYKAARAKEQRGIGEELGKEEMGAAALCNVQCYFPLLALLLCSWLFLHPSQAFKLHGGYDEEKVPLTFIVPDPSPGLSPLAAPPPVTGADDDGMRPRLPTERWRRARGEERRDGRGEERRAAHAPALAPSSAGPAHGPASADAPAPDSGSGTAFIKSSPAVPVPRGVTDTATILPMPAPGVKRQDVGAATLVRAGMVPLVVGFIMMASLGALF